MGGGDGQVVLDGCGGSFWEETKVLEVDDSSNGHTECKRTEGL